MATQFSGNDKANLLSTALSADSGDNVAITSTSDAVATGGAEKDTIVLGFQLIPSPRLAVPVLTPS